MNKVLALTEDGRITYCTCPPELRGKGRCNHVKHQMDGQSSADFVDSISQEIKMDSELTMADQRGYTLDILKRYDLVKQPNWSKMLEELPNPFVVGSERDGTLEEAELKSVSEEVVEHDGEIRQHIVATYLFRGKEYSCDYGEVPLVAEDGTLTIHGVRWRVLPIVSQEKAGVISSFSRIIVKQEDERNIAFTMSKDPEDHMAYVYGKPVPLENVQNFLQKGETDGLNSGQIYALSHIDPVAFQRFPELSTDLKSLKSLEPDEPNDISWRRCIRYEDMVRNQYRLQQRRMGVTFRKSLGDGKEPLFYQKNLTENIQSDLVKRSNVQIAENLNPIAALSQMEKVSFTGLGGFNKDKAPYELRLPHPSHEGIIDSMDVSSGKNVGLTMCLSKGYIGEDRFIHPKDPDKCLEPSDFIPFKYHNDPVRGSMAVGHMKQACPLLGGEDPIVKTPAWDHIAGAGLGVNLKVAYISEKGDFEDAGVISESAAKRMATKQSQKYECKDLRGVQVGDTVTRKQMVNGVQIKYGGTIKSVQNGSFEVETVYAMGPGDKFAGRHGNKTTISEVRPDHLMPKMQNERGEWEPVECILSPTSVLGRKNLGQVMETNRSMGKGDYDSTEVVHPNGDHIKVTAGKQFIMRLNHISEKKLLSYADEKDSKNESQGARLGEMDAILLSSSEKRLQILNYLRNQEAQDSHNKLHHLLKAIGVEIDGVNWDD